VPVAATDERSGGCAAALPTNTSDAARGRRTRAYFIGLPT
jgi:hypothetical protein